MVLHRGFSGTRGAAGSSGAPGEAGKTGGRGRWAGREEKRHDIERNGFLELLKSKNVSDLNTVSNHIVNYPDVPRRDPRPESFGKLGPEAGLEGSGFSHQSRSVWFGIKGCERTRSVWV